MSIAGSNTNSNTGDWLTLTKDLTAGCTLSILPGDNDKYSSTHGIIEILQREFRFAKDEANRLYYYDGGVYKLGGEEFIKQAAYELLWERQARSSIKAKTLNELAELMVHDVPSLMPVPPISKINVLNGIYDLETKQLLAHSPDYLTSLQLPITYDPTATCPYWNKFISEVFPNDCHDAVIWEIVAWMMIPLTTIKKFILLYGSGNNGKSIFLAGLRAFIGKGNYSSLSLHEIQGDKFAASKLKGKLANICGELPPTKLPATDMIKKLTGGDPIEAESKFKDRFEFKNYARMIYSANELFRSKDKSDGYYNRFQIIPMPNHFKENPRIAAQLEQRLVNASELSGVFNKALQVVDKVINDGITTTKSMQAVMEEYRKADNVILQFIHEVVRETVSITTPFSSMYATYTAYCEHYKMPLLAAPQFGVEVKKLRPQWKQVRNRRGERFYKDVDLLPISKVIASKPPQ